MCKKVNYSKYQKRVIKFLTELLGTGTPFSYEKTQTNHLKVLIDGVPKPLYTSSTPSDSKSLNNFMAEVKREIKATQSEMTFKPASAPKKVAIHREVSFERLILTCIKSIRTRLDVLKTQEESQVLEAKQVEIVAPFRTDIIKQVIKVARQAQKQISYIKPGDMSFIEEKLKSILIL